MNYTHLLGQRYEYSGEPHLNLNETQKKYKALIEEKIKDGVYKLEHPSCPICGNNKFECLSTRDRYGLYFPVGICITCGLVQAIERMDNASYNEFYNLEYRKLYHGTENPDEFYLKKQYNKGRLIYNYLNRYDNNINSRKFVLEIGCSMGGILKYFKDKDWKVKGIDLGEEYIKFGRDKLEVDIEVGTVNSLKLDETPDLVIINHVLEHLLDPNEDIKKIFSLINSDSIVYVSVPGVKLMTRKKEMDFLRYIQNAHIFYFSLQTVKNLFSKNGFDLIYGDEGLKAIFKKRSEINDKLTIENDFEEMKKGLVEHEKKYMRYSSFPFSIFNIPKDIFIKIRKKYRKNKILTISKKIKTNK